MTDYIKIPFAAGGTQTVIPDVTPPDGSVSFTDGFGADYEKSLTTDPSALPIDRAQFNYLMNIICDAIRYLQQNGFPAWITSADNGGTPYPYAVNAIVRYTDNNLYASLVATNTATPGTDPTKWELVTLDFNPMPTVVVTGAAPHTTTMLANTCYITTNTGLETFNLPAVSAVGDEIMVICRGAGLFKIAQPNAASKIELGNQASTLGTGGYVLCQSYGDVLKLKCATTSGVWTVMSDVGNFTGH